MSTERQPVYFALNGEEVAVADDGASLLEALRDRLGIRSVKDGCSPQGQCGCCTVLVDGQPRVSCVTPVRRIRGRSVVTVEGLADAHRWAEALCSTGGSQCGFCTPGIIVRLAGAQHRRGRLDDGMVRDALKAHLCRCTGWQTIVEAAVSLPALPAGRDLDAASMRASLEGGVGQVVSPEVALGAGGFADDSSPPDALVAVRDGSGEWVVAETLGEARIAAGKVQGRRTTAEARPPIGLPEGRFDLTLQTSWVDPGYLETDASWCHPGGAPASPLANGGAFGGKLHSEAGSVARRLADEHGRPVRVLFSREDVARLAPKRPPVAAGVRADGSGMMLVARTAGIADAVAAVAPGLEIREVDIPGPPTSASIRGAGWVEAGVLLHLGAGAPLLSSSGAGASASFDGETVTATVRCGQPLDEVVLRSYCVGAAHMAYSWVTSESLTVADDGEVLDLTVRSLGVARAVDTPRIEIEIHDDGGPPVNGSDAVFAAVAAAVWRQRGLPPVWPTG